jgi:hypothetical protein
MTRPVRKVLRKGEKPYITKEEWTVSPYTMILTKISWYKMIGSGLMRYSGRVISPYFSKWEMSKWINSRIEEEPRNNCVNEI